MSRPLRALAVAVALALPVALTAPAGASAARAKAPAPWSKAVCTKVGAWRSTIEKAADQAVSGSPSTAKAAKKALVKLLDRSFKATKKLVKDLKKIGAPKGSEGKQVASILRQGYLQAQSTIGQARTEMKAAPTSDTGSFQAAAHSTEDALEAGLEHVQQAVRAASLIDDPALVEAMAAESACTDLMA